MGMLLNFLIILLLYQPCKHTAGERDAKNTLPRFCQKIPPPDTGSGAERIQFLWHLRTIHALRFVLLRIFAQGGPHLFWIAGVVSIFCINAASSSGSCFAGSCSATTAARYSAWDIAGSKRCRAWSLPLRTNPTSRRTPFSHQTVQHRKKSSVPSICAPTRVETTSVWAIA